MNQVLKELGRAIDSDRAYILETAGIKIDNVFEYTKEDVPSNAHQLKNIPFSILKEWTNTSSENGYIEMDDIDVLEDENPYLYEVFHKEEIARRKRVDEAKKQLEATQKVETAITSAEELISKDRSEWGSEEYKQEKELID